MRRDLGFTALAPPLPEILSISTYQQRSDTLRCAGNLALSTPHLDALAARRVRYRRAYPKYARVSSNPLFTGSSNLP